MQFSCDHRDGPAAFELLDLDQACEELAGGRPVIVPNACPMAYIVLATSPGPINALKGRPGDQSVGIAVPRGPEWHAVAPAINLSPVVLARMTELMDRELLSFLIPLRIDVPYPAWIRPAVRNRQLGVFARGWAPLTRIWEQFPRLFGSSANRTGDRPAATAAEALSAFGSDVVIVDGDSLREPGCSYGSSTIVRISPDGQLSLHRPGAQDAASGMDAESFIRTLEHSL